jgi:glycosyltransferase involved in cell wall biosynthesis
VREVVTGDTGIVVPRGDVAALAGAIVEMAADPRRRETCGLAARRRALGRYGADRLLGDVDALYRELTAARRRPAV